MMLMEGVEENALMVIEDTEIDNAWNVGKKKRSLKENDEDSDTKNSYRKEEKMKFQ